MRTAIRSALLFVLVATVSAACATTRAAAPAERPALEVPIPPPRVIAPLPGAPETPSPEPVADLPGTGASTPARPRPPRDRDSKPETKPDETKPAEQTPQPAPVTPPPQLRIPETDTTQLTAQIREIVRRTREILSKIDYRVLTGPLQKAYDDAKLFADQAEGALKANNLVFAKELAEKGERLAKEVQGR